MSSEFAKENTVASSEEKRNPFSFQNRFRFYLAARGVTGSSPLSTFPSKMKSSFVAKCESQLYETRENCFYINGVGGFYLCLQIRLLPHFHSSQLLETVECS
ncbi:hypothetical protein AVEN_61798-1 [Araneus ventricosus]|uniref:Uncharacterized protein n=1 Tax=Araneus ventricosus TaxID=182803 RepID=A0A4Y2AR53_ARAVE|nr:hypothetical protein AVEN_61798-1 [Araneus ventricosus]